MPGVIGVTVRGVTSVTVRGVTGVTVRGVTGVKVPPPVMVCGVAVLPPPVTVWVVIGTLCCEPTVIGPMVNSGATPLRSS